MLAALETPSNGGSHGLPPLSSSQWGGIAYTLLTSCACIAGALVVFVDPVVEWLRLPTSMQTVGSPKFMASALAFSSGIMLYTGMAVLPSEAVAFFQDANQSSILVKYHRSVTVAFFIAGILLNWVIGKVVHRITPANSTISDGCVLHGPIPADLATPVSDCRPKSSDSGNSHSHGGSNLRAYLSGSAIHSHGAALSPSIPPVSPGECSPLLHSCHTRQPKAADSSSTAGVNNVDAAASKRSRTPTLESCADMDEAHSDVAQDVIVIDSASQAYSNPSYIPVHLSTPDFAHAALAGIQTAIALSIHKLTEGFIIYSSKQASPHLGAVILVTLLVHNFPEGMTLALSSTSSGVHSHARAFAIAAGVALFPSLAGAIIALLITSPHHATQGPGPSSHIVAASLSPSRTWPCVLLHSSNADLGPTTSTLFGCIFAVTAGMLTSLSVINILPSARVSEKKARMAAREKLCRESHSQGQYLNESQIRIQVESLHNLFLVEHWLLVGLSFILFTNFMM